MCFLGVVIGDGLLDLGDGGAVLGAEVLISATNVLQLGQGGAVAPATEVLISATGALSSATEGLELGH